MLLHADRSELAPVNLGLTTVVDRVDMIPSSMSKHRDYLHEFSIAYSQDGHNQEEPFH